MAGKETTSPEHTKEALLNHKAREKQRLEDLKKNKQSTLKRVKKRSMKKRSEKSAMKRINEVKRDEKTITSLEASINLINGKIAELKTKIEEEEKAERKMEKSFLEKELGIWKKVWKKEKQDEREAEIPSPIRVISPKKEKELEKKKEPEKGKDSIFKTIREYFQPKKDSLKENNLGYTESTKKKELEKTIDETSALQLDMSFNSYLGNPVVRRIKSAAEKEAILITRYQEALANEKSFFYNMQRLWYVFSPKESEKLLERIQCEGSEPRPQAKSKLQKILEKIDGLFNKVSVEPKFEQNFSVENQIGVTGNYISKKKTASIENFEREERKDQNTSASIINLVMSSARKSPDAPSAQKTTPSTSKQSKKTLGMTQTKKDTSKRKRRGSSGSAGSC